MKQTLLMIMVILVMLSLAAEDFKSIEGVWTGDKGLGNVYLYADGSGYLTFTHDPELTMDIQITRQGDSYLISQNEPNRWEFLTYALPREVAINAQEILRPMVWKLNLSGDGSSLRGIKLTSSIEWDSQTMEISNYDNEKEREAVWSRQEGAVSKDFDLLIAEDQDLHFEVFSVTRKGSSIVVQFNVTNLKNEDRDYKIFHNTFRIIDGQGRTFEDINRLTVGSDEGSSWAGAMLIEGIPIFNQVIFENIPGDLEEIKALEISGLIDLAGKEFAIRFRDVDFFTN